MFQGCDYSLSIHAALEGILPRKRVLPLTFICQIPVAPVPPAVRPADVPNRWAAHVLCSILSKGKSFALLSIRLLFYS